MTCVHFTHPAITARHAFFTRQGGVSQGAYASLNGSFSGGDNPAHVSENRARAARAIGASQLLGLKQVHGTAIITVTEPWAEGVGPAADGMVTRQPGIGLGIITADCAPVLLQDARAGVIGAVHAGWRGAAAGVVEAAIAAMGALGARPDSMAAVIGPCIGQASYEVGPDLRDAVLPTLPGAAAFFAPGRAPDRFQFDLAGYVLARLRAAGVGAPHMIGMDTCADPDRFFSHRRRTLAGGGPIGHLLSAITL